MAWQGYLVKIGDWVVPDEYIQFETYKTGSNKEKLDDWVDYAGQRHAVYSNEYQAVVRFNTEREFKLTNREIGEFMEALSAARGDTSVFGHNVDAYLITYYAPALDDYVSNYFTLDELEFTVWGYDENEITYAPVTFIFREVAKIEL